MIAIRTRSAWILATAIHTALGLSVAGCGGDNSTGVSASNVNAADAGSSNPGTNTNTNSGTNSTIGNNTGSNSNTGNTGNNGSSNGGSGDTQTSSTPLKYDVQLTRTGLGVPHINAKDFGSMGYGLGYAFAEDNLCVFLDDLVTIRGERSRYFGPDGTYKIEANDSVADNVSSDFFWKSILTDSVWQKTRDKTLPDYQNVVAGYVDGFNRYISELKSGAYPGRHQACANGQWLQPITAADMYRRFVRLSVLASSSVFVKEIGNAQPPGALPLVGQAPVTPAGRHGVSSKPPTPLMMAKALKSGPNPLASLQTHDQFGSNMYGFGSKGTESGQSMIYGNPHFPWKGTERLYLSHMTIPGKIDIMGVGLYGVPAVLIGFNQNVAWSHTVSTAYRFTFYQLQVNPQNPTQYKYEGKYRDMTKVPLSIQVKNPDGSLKTMTRTLYKSHFGPMITLSASGVPVLGWNNAIAYTMRDANLENDRLINQFARWNQAANLTDFIKIHKEVLGVPWVNTVASGPGQPAYYGDITVVPNVPDSKVKACQSQPIATVLSQIAPGLPVLDGSKASCEWGNDPDAPAPGIFGASHLPTLIRDDYVHNCNDSYWLTNPAQPVTGYARIIGDEKTPRSLRTRQCILQAERRLAGTDGLPGNKFNMSNLQQIALSSQILSADLARDTVVNTICKLPALINSQGSPVQTQAACDVLKNWDRRANLNSVGAHVWREFWQRASTNPGGLPIAPPSQLPVLWTTTFNANEPYTTPRDLNPVNPSIYLAFADAITAINAAGIPMNQSFDKVQSSGVHINSRIPIFGGTDNEGAFTVVSTPPLSKDGYKVEFGNSYIQTVTWTQGDNPRPIAEAMLTYSLSTDPASPYYDNYTKVYSQKQWQRLPFETSEIVQQKVVSTRLTAAQ